MGAGPDKITSNHFLIHSKRIHMKTTSLFSLIVLMVALTIHVNAQTTSEPVTQSQDLQISINSTDGTQAPTLSKEEQLTTLTTAYEKQSLDVNAANQSAEIVIQKLLLKFPEEKVKALKVQIADLKSSKNGAELLLIQLGIIDKLTSYL